MPHTVVDVADLPPPARPFSEYVEWMLQLTPGKALLFDAVDQQEQLAIQNRLANKLKAVRARSPYYFRTMKTRTQDGVLQVAVICEDKSHWHRS
ncbi:MAG: hypothetical protein C5B60_04785 [Chloroflexi bacterium]|nr:MAG: hypothetical protein C5B60_04785 [Chloroflexota bacterium]